MVTKVKAPITGVVQKVVVSIGSEVKKGDPIVILVSMKMEIPIGAEADGKIVKLEIAEGVSVIEGDTIAEIE